MSSCSFTTRNFCTVSEMALAIFAMMADKFRTASNFGWSSADLLRKFECLDKFFYALVPSSTNQQNDSSGFSNPQFRRTQTTNMFSQACLSPCLIGHKPQIYLLRFF